MKIYSKILPLVIILAISITACSKKKSGIPVPKDAAIVFHIDGASLNSKLSWDEVKKSEWFKNAMEMAEEEDEMAKKLLNNPEESGIDIKSSAYIFLTPRGRGGYAGVVVGLKDEKKFEAFIQKAGSGREIKKRDGMSVIEDGSVITWKGNKIVVIADNPDVNSGSGFMNDEREEYNFETDSLLYFAKEIHGLSGKKSLGSNSKFASLMDEKGDMHFWVNSTALSGNMLSGPLSLTKIGKLFEDNIGTGTLSFDNGKITMRGKQYYGKELSELYKKHSMKNLNEDMLKKIPGDVAAVMAMNYPPEGLQDFIKLLGVDGLVNVFLGQAGFSISDFIKANKGDILLAVSDFTIAEKEVSVPMGSGEPFVYKTTQPDAKFIFGASVNDMGSFQKLMDVLKKQIEKEGGEEMATIQKAVPYQLKDNWFIAGNDAKAVNGFGSSSTDHSFINKIKGHPMGGYIDIQKFINGSRPSMGNDSVSIAMANESLKYWQDIVFYGGEFKNNATEIYAEINMVDKNMNSLKQLNNYFGFFANMMMARERKWEDDVDMPAVVDTPVVTPPSPR